MVDFVTIEEYKEAEGISSPKEDLRLNNLIPSVSQLVKTYCGNSIVDYYSTNKIEVINIDWQTHIVQLTESPVNTIVSILAVIAVPVLPDTLTEPVMFVVPKIFVLPLTLKEPDITWLPLKMLEPVVA